MSEEKQRNDPNIPDNLPDKEPQKGNQGFQWKQAGKTSLIWVIILISAIFVSGLFTNSDRDKVKLEYWEYEHFLTSGLIASAEIIEKEFHGKLKRPTSIERGTQRIPIESFWVVLPREADEAMEAEWKAKSVQYTFSQPSVDWMGYLLSMAPWLLLIVFWIFIMRRMQGAAGGAKGLFSFGRSKARLWTTDKPGVTFEDVAGCEEAKTELTEIIQFLKNPKRFQKLGGRIPKGVLLLGPPGTGKTLMARAVAGEAGVPFFSISGADFVEMFVGVGASRVRDLFEQGKKHAPAIVFIDEIDAVGRHRGAGLGGGHDEREQTLNALLVEMDGFEPNTNIIILAATNRPDVLDSALLRPGRFDRQVVVDAPDLRGRLGILKVHTREIPMKDVDLEIIAKGTPGLVGADLENIVNEAALLAARKDKSNVDMDDFEEAKDKVMMGVERKSMLLSDEEKELTAYHESGHALAAKLLPDADPVHKVTIIPRGRALGLTAQLPIDEKHNYAKSYIETRLKVLMGGRVAEQIIFGELTTGGGNDIEIASKVARKMVCEWGMSDVMGPLTFGKKEEEIFLGREIAKHRDYSELTAQKIDEEVSKIITDAEKSVMKLLNDNVEKLHALAKVLLEYETIDGTEIDGILAGEKLKRRPAREQNGQTVDKEAKPEMVSASEPVEEEKESE
ncbi:MAG: ATP-dependent zinc metalloprotease FtsH [Fidelibacterota bacterium]